jgi:heat shock protein HslJ
MLLLALGCQAAAQQQIEGMYRFGHEVNTVCSGEPEACYWLVDTTTEIRQQLQQQVAGLAPYTPVCLDLLAELSATKADGFGLDYDGSIRVLQVLGRCDDHASPARIGIEDLRHHRWVLHSIDGLELAELARRRGYEDATPLTKVPELDFAEQDYVAANTGCNQFHGRASVVDDNLVLSQLATTAMSCAGFAAELELELQLLYRSPLAISRDGNTLILSVMDRELRYLLRDWVQ